MYLEQIKRLTQHIPQERIFFFVLEKFLADKRGTLSDLSDFLDIDINEFPANVEETYANKAQLPRYEVLETFTNRLLRSAGNSLYLDKLPFQTPPSKSQPLYVRALKKL